MELEGTFPPPEAHSSTALCRASGSATDEAAEEEILERHGSATRSTVELDPVVSAEELACGCCRRRRGALRADPAPLHAGGGQATRRHSAFTLGASPRAELRPFRASRTLAALRGRAFVIPDDIQEMALPSPAPADPQLP